MPANDPTLSPDDDSPETRVALEFPDLPRHVLDSLLEGCQVVSREWVYLYVNDAAAQQGRATPQDLLGRTMQSCYPGIEDTPMFAMLRETMERRVHHRLENQFTYPDGRMGWFELRFVPVPEGVFILSLDITPRRMRESEHIQLAQAISESAEAVVITDTQGAITYVNPGFEAITGYQRDEILGRNVRLLGEAPPGENPFPEMWQRITTHQTWRGRIINRRKDGSTFTQDTSISPVHDAHGVIVAFVSVGRDITQALRMEAQLQQTQRLETIGRLAGGVAHDFNNLLSVIISFAEVAMDGLPADEALLREDLGQIRDAGHRAAALTRQLLTFSRQQVVQPEVLDLNAAVQRMETMLRRLLREDIDLRTVLSPELARIRADPGQLEQVVMNLVVNAGDAMPRGGFLTVTTANQTLDDPETCRRLGLTPGRYVVLSVADTGVGMTPEVRERLFEPFFTTKGPGSGTGLGLSTVYGIVRQSGGAVSVYSELDVGSTLRAYFPWEDAEVVPMVERRQSTGAARPHERILVVEDEAGVRLIADRILRQAGYEVVVAPNGAEAFTICAQQRFDLLLTDVVMPKMSGRELAERIEVLQPGIGVLFMSGYADDAVIHHGVLHRDAAFISKPFGTMDLTRRVRRVLDQRAAAAGAPTDPAPPVVDSPPG